MTAPVAGANSGVSGHVLSQLINPLALVSRCLLEMAVRVVVDNPLIVAGGELAGGRQDWGPRTRMRQLVAW